MTTGPSKFDNTRVHVPKRTGIDPLPLFASCVGISWLATGIQKSDSRFSIRCRVFADERLEGDNAVMDASKPPEEWRDRLAAQGWHPETFLVVARLFCQLANRLTPAVLT